MGRYALVKDGVTVNIIVWDGVTPYAPPDGCSVVPEDQAPPMVVDAGQPPVPTPVERGQIMVALYDLGKLDEVESFVAQAPARVQLAWREFTQFHRDNQTLIAMWALLPSNQGKTAQELSDSLDDMFRAADAARG